MRFSAVAALCAAPLALASSLQADLVARGAVNAEKGAKANANANSGNSIVVQESGAVSSTEVVIIWVNNGGGAATQTVTTTQTVIGSSTVSAATHQVTVGGTAGLVYSPDNVLANVGDMVVFTFLSQNHTATQSAFATPCEKLTGGMDSGFMPNINGSVNPAPQMAMQVTVATPIWFYCRQTGHCGKGMTFSINPQNGQNGNKTQAAFQQLAISQNGTGSTAVIAGGTGASSAAPVSIASATASAAAVQSASAGSSGLTSGSGTLNSNGACDCSCLCGTAAFPAAVQGIGGFGGMSG
ncbi:uncharacterized protein LY89DRAFT_699994 [Mollisia scopiformis]|uniref:Uncharacterized protein n=1 Tax=Mollisia scopiformis TaxID=149040 RepID=A0A194WVN3_MOLSC|nr:uncharacterized protein LY89DRAFT_699994 [Mollisia scopiformis]KUJ12028.1 hypothetical protein LY89DRAFT_699994 [Mollisia scopiformis]